MKIAVLSGKGGAGKTFVAVNLACSAGKAVYVDCDVEEPNGRLFLKPQDITESPVFVSLPEFDAEKCSGCRKCVDFCRFGALIYVKNRPMLFSELCHACGGCALVCPEAAVSEGRRQIGHVEKGRHGALDVVTGVLNPGEASGVPVIKAALSLGEAAGGTQILDCPPGSACSVMESISGADFCLLVAEPTAFGLHNFKMVHELASLLGKPCGVVINKQEASYPPLERFCREAGLPVLLRIPYIPALARLCGDGEPACEKSGEYAAMFRALLEKIGGRVE